MPSYIELDKQASFPSSSNTSKMIFGVNSSNEAILVDSSGTTYNFGTGSTSNPNYDTYTIDLSIDNYTISASGIYQISVGDDTEINKIFFPNPSTLIGGTIILINTDSQNGFFDNTYQILSLGTSNQITKLSAQNMISLYSINDKWRGGGLAAV